MEGRNTAVKDSLDRADRVCQGPSGSGDGSTIPQKMYGNIKSFTWDKGYGFIECVEISGDAYFQTRDLVGFSKGQILQGVEVMFEVTHLLCECI